MSIYFHLPFVHHCLLTTEHAFNWLVELMHSMSSEPDTHTYRCIGTISIIFTIANSDNIKVVAMKIQLHHDGIFCSSDQEKNQFTKFIYLIFTSVFTYTLHSQINDLQIHFSFHGLQVQLYSYVTSQLLIITKNFKFLYSLQLYIRNYLQLYPRNVLSRFPFIYRFYLINLSSLVTFYMIVSTCISNKKGSYIVSSVDWWS